MAPGLSFKIRLFFLFMAVGASILPTPARAASQRPAKGQDPSAWKEHTIKFYLDPVLVPDLDFAKMVLVQYVQDMNFVLQKNTGRRLVFDPSTGIILTKNPPHTDWSQPPLPEEGFEIWAHAIRTNHSLSYGGYSGIDVSGAGVLAGLKWTRLYNPEQLTMPQVKDYWTQINNMLHELAHVFGAGYGEYYGLSSIQDTTGVAPLLNINVYDVNDAFWSDKPDFRADPLLWNPAQVGVLGGSPNRESLLSFVRYSELTASLIRGNYRNSAPMVDLSQIELRIVDTEGLPIDSANVKVWSVAGGFPNSSQWIAEGLTSQSGDLKFAWGGAANPHNSYDFLRLIKVYKDGYQPSAAYISIYDTDIARLVGESSVFLKEIVLEETTPSSPFTDVTAQDFAYSWIERLYTAKVTGGCSAAPLRYCPQQVVTREQMAIFLERSMNGPSYTPAAVAGNMFGDVLSSHWSAAWIGQLAADGITGGCGNGNFCPNAPVTRAQMAVFLLRAKYGARYTPPSVGDRTGFADVSADYWSAAWIKQLVAEGITSGCGNGNYCPEAPVTRAQMAVFLGKTFTLP